MKVRIGPGLAAVVVAQSLLLLAQALGAIDLPWYWLAAPLWLPFTLGALIFVITFVVVWLSAPKP